MVFVYILQKWDGSYHIDINSEVILDICCLIKKCILSRKEYNVVRRVWTESHLCKNQAQQLGCISLGKLLNLSKPLFSHLLNGDRNSLIHLLELQEG